MKVLNVCLLLLVMLLASGSVVAQGKKQPMTYSQFCDQKDLQVNKGFYTIYRLGDQYYIEIPAGSMGREVMITTQVVKGYSSFISNASGVIRFSEGRNNMLQVIRNRAVDISVDSTDACMREAIRKSGLIPVDHVLPIVARGEDGHSAIIELTGELNNAGSYLFNVSSYSMLSHPDPERSGVNGFRMLNQGVVFSVSRSQTDYNSNPQTGEGKDVASTYELEMVIQMLPEQEITLKPSHPAYGFETIGMTGYDTKKYVARKREYIQKWNLTASPKEKRQQRRGGMIEPDGQICIYIDPITPAPFVESIKQGLQQWEEAFKRAGWVNVFRISSAPENASLTYRTILFRWGNAFNGLNSSVITNPLTGEILAARVNVMDVVADELLETYFLQCGLSDSRIRKDMHSLDVRQDVLTAQVAAAFAEVLGMKPNKSGYMVFAPADLRSEKWLNEHGITASITSDIRFNYLVQQSDRVSAKNLFPKVSAYDYDAVKYAYGNSDKLPSVRDAFYTATDKQSYTKDMTLSNDILESSLLGIRRIQEIYPRLGELVERLPEEQNTWNKVADLSLKSLALYQTYLTQIVNLVGGQTEFPIIKGVNEVPVVYTSKEQQQKALEYLEKVIFNGVEAWVYEPRWDKISQYDLDQMMVGLAEAVAKRFIDPKALASLVAAERTLGSENAFTLKDLFSYIDRVIFENFDTLKPVSAHKRNLQACFVSNWARMMADNNISFGLGNEAIGALHAYFIDTVKKIKALSESHEDSLTRENCGLMLMRVEREYFNKN